MEFAGKPIDETAFQGGRILVTRLLACETLPPDETRNEPKMIRSEVDAAITTNMDTAVSFVLHGTNIVTDSRDAFGFGRVFAYTSIAIMKKDSEIGKRLIHNLLTHQDQVFSDGAWQELTKAYEKGKVSYDDFNRFMVARHLK